MGDILPELVPLLNFLLPGFVATTIFYWLSDAQKPGQFERLVQAVIGTTLISLVVPLLKDLCFWIGGHWWSLGAWTERSDVLVALHVALAMGLGLAFAANHDIFYRLARWLSLTSRASHSDWAYAFRTRPGKWVVLHFLDDSRLIGYPLAWPNNPADGHFLMLYPHWMDEDGSYDEDDDDIDCMIVSNVDVKHVEILKKGIFQPKSRIWEWVKRKMIRKHL